ncbi:HigA family addiction module antidote protein [bacterium]|nr:HigA family addiction module antidote protein [bacterium]
MNKPNHYTDIPVHPGEHLKDTLKELDLSQTQLANRIGLSRKVVNSILNGKAPITPSTSILLERVLGMQAHIWNNLQQNYDLNMAYLSEQKRIKLESTLLNQYPIKQMKKFRWIVGDGTREDNIKDLYKFFGVASLANIEKTLTVQFRRSLWGNTSKEAIYTWLCQGEKEAKVIEIESFDKDKLTGILPDLRQLTKKQPVMFQDEVVRLCANAGVAVVFVPDLPKTHINGATFWLDNHKKATILLSLRFKTNDHLWFSFFHEVGHILLHTKKESFLDLDNNELDADDMEKEDQANQFAADLLIPPEAWDNFSKISLFTKINVIHFADEISIAPGIVVGRLQRERLLPFTHLNGLKERYEWVVNN